MSLRWTILALALAACDRPRGHLSEPAQPLLAPLGESCEGLVVHQTVHFGGAYEALAHDEGLLYAASSGRIDIITEPGAAPTDRIPVPGETHHMLVLDDELWVASGSAGITRIRSPQEPERRSSTRWPWPGDVRTLTSHQGMIWAADKTGRVLALPRDATNETDPSAVTVDGWPNTLAPWGEGVIVSTQESGFLQVRREQGELATSRPDQDISWAGPFLSEGDEIWVNTHDDLVHLKGLRQVGAAPTPPLVRVVPWRESYVLAAAMGSGVLQWDGGSVDTYAWSLRIPGTDEKAPAHDIVPLDGQRVAVAAGRAGVLWARDEGTGWSVDGWTPSAGVWEAVAPLQQGLAAALTTTGGGSLVLLLDLNEQGELVELDRIPVPTQVTGLLLVGDELLVSSLGVYSIDLERPPGQREAVHLDLLREPIHGLAALPTGRIAGLIRGRAVVWLERGAQGWTLVDESALGSTFTPMAIVSWGETVGVTYAGHGRLRLFDEPGSPPWGEHVLAGQVASSDAGIMRPPGTTALGDHLWFALPHIGVEALIPGDTDHRRIRFQPGAWDAKDWNGLLAVALGLDGVGVLAPDRPDEPWLGRCDLPGDTRKLVPVGDRLIAFGGGSATVLERR
jgi:hypothetical protein